MKKINWNLFFEQDAPRGPSTANAYILLDTGTPSQSLIDDLNEYVMEKGFHGHGDDLQVIAMPSINVSVGVTIYPHDYYMSELGLIERINREILHPLGLAICRQVESGVSEKILVADDGVFEYGPEINSKPLTYEQVQTKLMEFENEK